MRASEEVDLGAKDQVGRWKSQNSTKKKENREIKFALIAPPENSLMNKKVDRRCPT